MSKSTTNKCTTGVFERYGRRDTVSKRVFYCILVFVLLWGFIGTAILAELMAQWKLNAFLVFFLGFVISNLGMFIAIISDNWIVSFAGYNMFVIPIGAMLGPVLNRLGLDIRDPILITTMITGVMGCVGIAFPRLFERLGYQLFWDFVVFYV